MAEVIWYLKQTITGLSVGGSPMEEIIWGLPKQTLTGLLVNSRPIEEIIWGVPKQTITGLTVEVAEIIWTLRQTVIGLTVTPTTIPEIVWTLKQTVTGLIVNPTTIPEIIWTLRQTISGLTVIVITAPPDGIPPEEPWYEADWLPWALIGGGAVLLATTKGKEVKGRKQSVKK